MAVSFPLLHSSDAARIMSQTNFHPLKKITEHDRLSYSNKQTSIETLRGKFFWNFCIIPSVSVLGPHFFLQSLYCWRKVPFIPQAHHNSRTFSYNPKQCRDGRDALSFPPQLQRPHHSAAVLFYKPGKDRPLHTGHIGPASPTQRQALLTPKLHPY